MELLFLAFVFASFIVLTQAHTNAWTSSDFPVDFGSTSYCDAYPASSASIAASAILCVFSANPGELRYGFFVTTSTTTGRRP